LSATLALSLYIGRDWALELYEIEKGTRAYETACARLNFMTSTYWLCGVAGVLAHARHATGRARFVFFVSLCSALTRIAWIYVVARFMENCQLELYLAAYPVSWLVGLALLLFGGKVVDGTLEINGKIGTGQQVVRGRRGFHSRSRGLS